MWLCYGVLPSTDARRITVREITVNICSMNMMNLAEDNLLCHLSLYGCLSYITPTLSLYLPAHLSLTHFHHLSFSVLQFFPSHPVYTLLVILTLSSTPSPPSFSFTLISPLTFLSLCQTSFVSSVALNFLLCSFSPLVLPQLHFSLQNWEWFNGEAFVSQIHFFFYFGFHVIILK